MKTGPSPSLLCSELRVSSDTLQLREDLCEEARLGIDPQHRPTGQMKANYFQQFEIFPSHLSLLMIVTQRSQNLSLSVSTRKGLSG